MSLLSELSKLDIKDLKNIDYVKLLENLRKRPDLIINIVVIFITFIIATNVFGKRRAEMRSLHGEVKILEEKIAAIDAYSATKEEMDQFLKSIPPHISEDDFINRITDMAVARKVQIESFAPTRGVSLEYYDMSGVVISVSSMDYKNLWLFVHDIENSPHAIRIDEWSGSMVTDVRRGRRSAASSKQKGQLNYKLKISAINYKNE